MKNRVILWAIAVMLVSRTVLAGGFQINEHGARAMAMGGAFTAIAFDPSAVYFNNAALSKVKGINAMLGTTIIAPSASFRGPYGPTVTNPTIAESKMESQVFTPSHLYVTYGVNDKLTLGFGVNNPFGLGTKWADDWVGRFVSIEADLKTFSFSLAGGYQLLDNLSIGAGLLYNLGSVTLERKAGFPPFAGEALVTLEGDESGAIGFSAGLLYEITKNLSFGFSYRSEVEYNFEGTATSVGPAILSSSLPRGDISATFRSPQQMVFGLGFNATEQLTFSADFQMVSWSSYDSLKVDFKEASLTDLAAPREYEDTYIIRFGAEYDYAPNLALRAGLLYDNNPVKDERVDASLPDSDRLGFSLGLGYNLTDKLVMDVSYLFLRFSERTITNSKVGYTPAGDAYMNGTYNSTASLFSVTFGYNF